MTQKDDVHSCGQTSGNDIPPQDDSPTATEPEVARLSPFRAGICWHGIKAVSRGPLSGQRFCSKGGDYYRVDSGMTNPMNPETTVKVYMWLCYDHVKKIEASGYKVTKVRDR
jgi:hypothetical protein